MKYSFICALTAAVCQAVDPEAPVWPTKFSEDFVEKMYEGHKIVASYYYDASDLTDIKTAVYRSNGRYDQICGLTHHNDED